METFESYRPLLFGIAYRMLGSVMEAEDMVQETYLRYEATPPETIRSLKAFLSTIITRLCLDYLKSARAQRETYIGPWLPEPLLTDELAPPPAQAAQLESISMAFLVLLESLSPLERAVFLLREIFDYDYADIAQILGREEASCRQLFSRARKHVTEQRPRFESSPENHRALLNGFMSAIRAGDLDGLTSLLAEDVVSWSDGGGKIHAATRPIYGRDRVSRFFIGLGKQADNTAITAELAEVNGKTGILVRVDGKPFMVITVETVQNTIREIRVIINPDKLVHLN
ncbi:MAG: RNA polymerase sigma-70 factor [Anaerolineae bacterium]|nr:RNA polymerase sigma-70 factor [Anaerolineae bacterium]